MTAVAASPLVGRPLSQLVLRIVRSHARDHAITAGELAHWTQSSERAVRKTVADLRRDGYPIASTPHEGGGFYWPRTLADAEECSRHLWSRVRQIADVARAFDTAARGLGLERGLSEQVRLVFEEGLTDAFRGTSRQGEGGHEIRQDRR
ncbi:MAG: HTH domain-containing protein [Anaerolineales bacterium]